MEQISWEPKLYGVSINMNLVTIIGVSITGARMPEITGGSSTWQIRRGPFSMVSRLVLARRKREESSFSFSFFLFHSLPLLFIPAWSSFPRYIHPCIIDGHSPIPGCLGPVQIEKRITHREPGAWNREIQWILFTPGSRTTCSRFLHRGKLALRSFLPIFSSLIFTETYPRNLRV